MRKPVQQAPAESKLCRKKHRKNDRFGREKSSEPVLFFVVMTFQILYMPSTSVGFLNPQIQSQQTEDQKVSRVKTVVKDLVLSAPLAIVGEGQGKSQQSPWFFVHGQEAEWDRQDIPLTEDVHEVTDEDSVVLVVQPQVHGYKAHDSNDNEGRQIPDDFRKAFHFSF